MWIGFENFLLSFSQSKSRMCNSPWCYTWTALLSAKQNRVIFSCILFYVKCKWCSHLYISTTEDICVVYKAQPKRSQNASATYRNIVGRNMLREFGHSCCNMLQRVGCCLLKFDLFQTWANKTQCVATHRNTVAKRTQRVAPNNVTICWFDMLRSLAGALDEWHEWKGLPLLLHFFVDCCRAWTL